MRGQRIAIEPAQVAWLTKSGILGHSRCKTPMLTAVYYFHMKFSFLAKPSTHYPRHLLPPSPSIIVLMPTHTFSFPHIYTKPSPCRNISPPPPISRPHRTPVSIIKGHDRQSMRGRTTLPFFFQKVSSRSPFSQKRVLRGRVAPFFE